MEQRNLILAIVLSIAILLGFQYFAPTPMKPAPVLSAASEPGPQGGASSAVGPIAPVAALKPRAVLLPQAPRLEIETPRLKGSINLKGARLDDVTLTDYRESLDPNSPSIDLLNPSGSHDALFAETGWIAKDPALFVPNAETVWQAEGGKLTPATPVTLRWDNGAGLVFTRRFSVDDGFMFVVRDGIENKTGAPVSVLPFGLISRTGEPSKTATWISYEGPMGAFNGVEENIGYSAIANDRPLERTSLGGWIGFSEKYWLTTLAPLDQTQELKASFRHSGVDKTDTQTYQADYLGSAITVESGKTGENAMLLFSGAKEVKLLNTYGDKYNLPVYNNVVDWGWFYFLTKPIFYLLDIIYGQVGNFGIAILILTLVIKALFFPLQTRAVINMNKMKELQPELTKLREKYGEDRVRLNQEMMALQKRVGANPIAGCLPILLQIPVFFSLYKVLYSNIEMRHAPFYGWIHDLSAPDPTSVFNLFGVLDFSLPQALMIGVWPLIYGATMFLQQQMQPAPPDPVQARMLKFMPIMLVFMMSSLPAGLMIYWSWSNVIGIGQSWLITRQTKKMAIADAKAVKA